MLCPKCSAENALDAARCAACGDNMTVAVLEVIRGDLTEKIRFIRPRPYTLGRARQNDIALEAARNRQRQAEHDFDNKKTTASAGIAIQKAAVEKAKAIALPDAVTIGSDTIVVVDSDVLGKPRDEADAAQMLRRLSGRSHVVITAVAAMWRGRMLSGVEEVGVTFRSLTEREIAAYIATGEPMDKAGAYGIQGYGATIVERVDGDYFAVMGLPLHRLTRLLEELGLRYDFGPLRLRT